MMRSLSGCEVYCISVSSYKAHLTFGRQYLVESHDPVKRQLRIRGDQEKLRWFREELFSQVSPKRISQVIMDDPLHFDLVDVRVRLDDRSDWFVTFSTPEGIARILKNRGYLLGTDLVFLTKLTEASINDALRSLEEQDELGGMLRPLAPAEA